jgi:hypothetical protein
MKLTESEMRGECASPTHELTKESVARHLLQATTFTLVGMVFQHVFSSSLSPSWVGSAAAGGGVGVAGSRHLCAGAHPEVRRGYDCATLT